MTFWALPYRYVRFNKGQTFENSALGSLNGKQFTLSTHFIIMKPNHFVIPPTTQNHSCLGNLPPFSRWYTCRFSLPLNRAQDPSVNQVIFLTPESERVLIQLSLKYHCRITHHDHEDKDIFTHDHQPKKLSIVLNRFYLPVPRDCAKNNMHASVRVWRFGDIQPRPLSNFQYGLSTDASLRKESSNKTFGFPYEFAFHSRLKTLKRMPYGTQIETDVRS